MGRCAQEAGLVLSVRRTENVSLTFPYSYVVNSLNFRTTINIYLDLGKFLEYADSKYQAVHPGASEDPSLDADFRSGVLLGVGASNMLLSLMPKTVISVVELFGYTGDRRKGLSMLMQAGGWKSGVEEPSIAIGACNSFQSSLTCDSETDTENEGLRRSLADIALLGFHLVLSAFVTAGVDMQLAENILSWNLQRYPKGANLDCVTEDQIR